MKTIYLFALVAMVAVVGCDKERLSLLQQQNQQLHISQEDAWNLFITNATPEQLKKHIENSGEYFPVDTIYQLHFEIWGTNYSVKNDTTYIVTFKNNPTDKP